MSATAVEDAFAAVKTFLWNERDVFGEWILKFWGGICDISNHHVHAGVRISMEQ
jgi:hypothetical protein